MNIKQVIVIRRDLNMRRGKEIAQGSHASMAVFLNRAEYKEEHLSKTGGVVNYSMEISLWDDALDWLQEKFTKVCVQVSSEQELLDIYNKAKEEMLPCAIIKDSGKTEFNGVPTYTCCAIGPYESEEINKITGHLKLY